MRIALFTCCFLSLVAIPATAADLNKGQCDVLIMKAFSMQDREASIRLLNSRVVQECFRQFPDLEYKHFPLRSDENGMMCDRGPAAIAGKGKCPERKDPAFTVKLR